MTKPVGRRGWWFARWQDEDLPCVHETYIIAQEGGRRSYIDQGVGTNPQWGRLIEAIKTERKVIVTSDVLDESGFPARRKGYRAIWRVDNVSYEHPVLKFDLIERLVDRFT